MFSNLRWLVPSRLQVALLFSRYDVQENRAGRLTFAQRQRVLWSTAYLPAAAALVLVAALAFEWELWFGYGVFSFYATPMGFVFGLGGAFMLLNAWRPHLLDALGGRVEAVEGPLVRRSTMGVFRRIHYVRIGPRSFELPAWATAQFEEGSWRCYFLPRTGRLLSAEPATDPGR